MTKVPSFSYKNTKRGIVVAITLVIAVMVSTVVFFFNPNQPYPTQVGGMAYPVSLPSMTAGCGDIYRIPPIEGNFGEIPEEFWELNKDNPDINIPVSPLLTVPIFGYMSQETLAATEIRFYDIAEYEEAPLDLTQILRSMYDDDIIVIWYTTDMDVSDIAALKAIAAEPENVGKMLIVPWTGANRPMIQGRDIAYAAWGISQTCTTYSEAVLNEFIEFEEENRVERPAEIPEAPMSKEGKLLPIGASFEEGENG